MSLIRLLGFITFGVVASLASLTLALLDKKSANDDTTKITTNALNQRSSVYDDNIEYTTDNNNNNYESNSPSPYIADAKHSGVADIIPADNFQTLDEKYADKNSNNNPYNNYNYNNYNTKQKEVILDLNFARDFSSKIDPNNNNSIFEWFGYQFGDPIKNGAFVTEILPQQQQQSESKNNYGNDNNNQYQAYEKLQPQQQQKSESFVREYILPFQNFIPNDTTGLGLAYVEGFFWTKPTYDIGPTQRLLLRQKISCKVINADKEPFSSDCVSNPWDDPRLGSCAFGIAEISGAQLFVYISVTNTGVWASYQRLPSNNSDTLSFTGKRRIGNRPRYDDIVDGAMEIDRRLGQLTFYLNGYPVWTINALGLPPPSGSSRQSIGRGTPELATPRTFIVGMGGVKQFDEKDPNNPNSNKRLLRVNGRQDYYEEGAEFCDDVGLPQNVLFGQGLIIDYFSLQLVRSESELSSRQPISGVYNAPPSSPPQKYEEEKKMPEENVSHD